MGKPVFFKFGNQIVRVSSENSDYLKEIANLLNPFRVDNPIKRPGGRNSIELPLWETNEKISPENEFLQGNIKKKTVSFNIVFPPNHETEKGPPCLIFQDDKEVFKTKEPFRLLFRLEWLIVRRLLEGSDFLQFHSAVLEKNGNCVIFPAQANSGKTSLTVALSQNGFQWFSDEIVLVDPESLLIYPFPRSILIEPEKKDLFSGLGYNFKSRKLLWKRLKDMPLEYISKEKTGKGKATGSKSRFIIFPGYSPEHHNKLKPLSSAKALMRLMENEVNFNQFQAGGIDTVIKLVKGADCFEMETGNLAEAVQVIKKLFSD